MKGFNLLGLLFLTTLFTISCSSDSYRYPSVRLELVRVSVVEPGVIDSVYLDSGEAYEVVENKQTGLDLKQGLLRAISYISISSSKQAVLHSLRPIPIYEAVEAASYPEDSVNDPVRYQRIWKGGGYLNFELLIKATSLSEHEFAFTEEIEVDHLNKATIKLKLYHLQNNDLPRYTHNYLLSLPIEKYYTQLNRDEFTIKVVILTDEGEEQINIECKR